MTYRKTWFSYVLWVIYTMLCAIFLVFVGNYVCVTYLSDSGLLSGHVIQWSGFLMVPAMVGIYWIIRTVSGKIRKKCAGRERVWRLLEVIVVWALFAIGIFLRITYVLNCTQLWDAAGGGASGCINGLEYFDMAMVRVDETAPPLAYGGAALYVSALSIVLSFLGNKAVSAVVFQIFLQIAGMVLAYAVTRRLAGRIPACVALLYLSCSTSYLRMLENLGPECFFFVLYLGVMLVAVSYVKGYCANRRKRAQALVGAAVTGILIGMLGYLDLTAVTILPVFVAAATGKKRRMENEADSCSSIMNGAVIAIAIFSCVAGVLGTTAVVSAGRGNNFINDLNSWVSLHIWNTQTFGFKPLYPYSLDMLFFAGLTALAAFLVFEFFRGGREQNYMLWILLCIVAAPTPLAVFGVQPFGLISMYIWAVLAGLGLQNCIFGGKAEFVQSVIEEINRAAKELESAEEHEEDAFDDETDIGDTSAAERTDTIDIPETFAEIDETDRDKSSEDAVGSDVAGGAESSAGACGTEESGIAAETEESTASRTATENDEEEKSEAAAEMKETLEAEGVMPGAAAENIGNETAVTDTAPKPRYLDNPLPLPKKHVRKKMDFQYNVDEKDMKFDLEVKEDDDFDI